MRGKTWDFSWERKKKDEEKEMKDFLESVGQEASELSEDEKKAIMDLGETVENKAEELLEAVEPEAEEPAEESPVSMQAVIPGDMVIHGSIALGSDIMICGAVDGDIMCMGSVLLEGGSVEGDIRCGSLTIDSGNLKGNTEVSGDVIMEGCSRIKGNISASGVRSNTESEGDIRVSGLASIGEKAVIRGNISAGVLHVACGARIKGMVEIIEPETDASFGE